jgi:NDP-sugar pyrophosphorylase family protein
LAGGLATRLRPITEKIPKGLVEIDGKPFLEYQIKLLKKYEIKNIILCVGYKGEMIEEYFGDGENFGVKISYSKESKPLGTGGAIRKAFNKLRKNFFVMYGDAYLNFDYKDIISFYEKSKGTAVLSIYKNKGKYDSSNVILDNNGKVLYDKSNPSSNMEYIDYGLSVLNKDLVKKFIPSQGFYDLADFYNEISKKELLLGYEVNERFYEIGSFGGLDEFKKYINS